MGGRRPALRVGIGGPVGSGKTTLIARICARLGERYSLAVVTNDVNAHEDARLLARLGALSEERISGLEAGSCRHTSAGDDASYDLGAVDALLLRHGDLEAVLIEGGDDLGHRAFDRELVDLLVYVIDVAAGEKAVRRGLPGITQCDLLVINKSDLAGAVGASLMNMERDAISVRGDRPYVFTNLKGDDGVDLIARFLVTQGMLG